MSSVRDGEISDISVCPLSIAPICQLAIAANLTYLNLPRFRYRQAIADSARPIVDEYKDITEAHKMSQYKLLKELADLPNDNGNAINEWKDDWGRTYRKWFSNHRDNRLTNGFFIGNTFFLVQSALISWADRPPFAANFIIPLVFISSVLLGFLVCISGARRISPIPLLSESEEKAKKIN